MSNIKYFNFPIYFLKDFMINPIKDTLSPILNYALYEHSQKLEEGSGIDKLKSSAKYFNVSMGDDKLLHKEGEKLVEGEIIGYPKAGINTKTYWDYRDNYKSEFDKVSLLAFLAIKSILQQKAYCKIGNKFWLARMDGKASSCEFEELSPAIRKYSTEYQIRKIKNSLVDNWNLVTYSRYNRGFYISLKLPLEKLAFEAEKQRANVKNKKRKAEIKQAYLNAMKRLNGQNEEEDS